MPTAELSSPPLLVSLLSHKLRWQLVTSLALSDMKVQVLVSRLNQPFNLVSYHLRKLREAALVKQHRSEADRRGIYYSLDLAYLESSYREGGRPGHSPRP